MIKMEQISNFESSDFLYLKKTLFFIKYDTELILKNCLEHVIHLPCDRCRIPTYKAWQVILKLVNWLELVLTNQSVIKIHKLLTGNSFIFLLLLSL